MKILPCFKMIDNIHESDQYVCSCGVKVYGIQIRRMEKCIFFIVSYEYRDSIGFCLLLNVPLPLGPVHSNFHA